MHLTAPLPLLPRTWPRPAPARPAPARPAAAHHQHQRSAHQARARRAGGPEDRAYYHCQCGYHWTGEVTASPGCPHCGTPQAW
jgi:rubrerythrin